MTMHTYKNLRVRNKAKKIQFWHDWQVRDHPFRTSAIWRWKGVIFHWNLLTDNRKKLPTGRGQSKICRRPKWMVPCRGRFCSVWLMLLTRQKFYLYKLISQTCVMRIIQIQYIYYLVSNCAPCNECISEIYK